MSPLSVTVVSGPNGSVVFSEAGLVGKLTVSASASLGGGEMSGVVKASVSAEVELSAAQLIDAGLQIAAAKFPAAAAEIAAAKAVIDGAMKLA